MVGRVGKIKFLKINIFFMEKTALNFCFFVDVTNLKLFNKIFLIFPTLPTIDE